jgi:peptidoglycan/xylan/chitin deacetylase (PgdA/CDA1 family)
MNSSKTKIQCLKFFLILFLGLVGFQQSAQALTEMAITIDDLPRSGPLPPNMTRMEITNEMLATLKKHHIDGVYGFINAGTAHKENGVAVLQKWVDDGQLLGNHTFTHENPNKISTQAYIKNIQENDPILEKLMQGKNYKYFRYPFLAEGNTVEKRDAIRNYLASQGYTIAPVTVYFQDEEWNPPYKRCLKNNNQKGIAWLEQSYMQQAVSTLQRAQAQSQFLFHRDVKQILLIHMGAFDAKMLDKLLTAYEDLGVKFISLPEALTDPIYKITPSFKDTKAFTFLNQLQRMQGLKTPKSVSRLYVTYPLDKLRSLN